MKSKKQIVYKVVDSYKGLSSFVASPSYGGLKYEVGKWIRQTDPNQLKYVFVFKDLDSATAFVHPLKTTYIKIFKCEATGLNRRFRSKHIIPVQGVTNNGFPQGTLLAKSVKLLEEVKFK